MKIKVGIDTVAIHRIQNAYEKYPQRFLDRFLSLEEQKICNPNPQSIAGFWAAKEACAKALGTGIGKKLSFKDIFITKDQANAPYIDISDKKKQYFGLQNFSLSITHDYNFAIAVVVAYS